uniref:Uncharacterized protein n=1 Tax=Ditylenchus dipsaci TaxID=166011 RepID=A0A915D919_9BILA
MTTKRKKKRKRLVTTRSIRKSSLGVENIIDAKAMLMVPNVFCLKTVDEACKKLERFEKYEEIKLSKPPPPKKPRRSDIF